MFHGAARPTDQAVRVLPRGLEPLFEQSLEIRIPGTIQSTHDIHILLFTTISPIMVKLIRHGGTGETHKGHLEWCSLEAHVPAGRVGEHEPEIDVDQVPVPIDEDIPVMPIFDLEEVRDDRVA